MKSAGQIITEDIRAAIRPLQRCVTPIFDVNSRGQAELAGSAVLIAMTNQVFLCTAEHVIKHNTSSSLYIDGEKKLELLEGDFFTAKGHDVSVLQLSTGQIAQFQKYLPLKQEHIGTANEAAACNYVEFIGFPTSKNKKIFDEEKIKGQLCANGCTVIEVTDERVRVNFNQKRNIDAVTRQRVTAPAPYGMSGGAMFGVAMNSDSVIGTPNPKLIGVSTNKPNSTVVFGTNISIVLQLIAHQYSVVGPKE